MSVTYTYQQQTPPPLEIVPRADCTVSRFFDFATVAQNNPANGTSGAPDAVISFRDRLPAGGYAIQRTATQSLTSYLSSMQSHSLRGIAFFLGDTEDYAAPFWGTPTPPLTQRSYGVQYAPNNASTAHDWQKLQYLLLVDQLPAGSTLTPTTIAGAQTFRAATRLVGGYFNCGLRGLQNPAATAYSIGNLRNLFSLDFILIDISQVTGHTLNDARALLTLFQHVQETYIRTPAGSSVPVVSQHCPTLAVVPPATAPYTTTFLSPDGCFEPVVNGYSGPKTFLAPRLPAGSTDISSAWQWARPINSSGLAMSRCEILIDCRAPGSVPATAAAATTRTSINVGGFTAQVYSGALFYDDLDHLVATGPLPTSYWNYDLDLVPNLVQGALVPSYSPDPMPIAQTNHDWAKAL